MAQLPTLQRLAPKVVERIYDAAQKGREQVRHTQSPPGTLVPLRMSGIGHCQRRQWAEHNDIEIEKPFSGRTLILFSLGEKIEEHVIYWLKRAGYTVHDLNPETRMQWEVSALDGRMLGHLDGKIELSQKGAVLLEVKSANDSQFALCRELGYRAWRPEYYDQITAYMGSSGLPESLVVVYNKNDSEIYTERIRFDPDDYKELLRKADYILTSTEVIAKPAEAKSQFCKYCKWCPVNKWCWDAATGVKFA